MNSLPDDSRMPIIILAVTCNLMYLMPVTLSISFNYDKIARISSMVSSGRGSLMAGGLLLSIIAFVFKCFLPGDGIARNGG